MTRALYTAATGMQAQQLKIDVIANNLANVNTDGFKKSRATFQDLVYQTLTTAQPDAGTGTVNGIQVGLGSRPQSTARDFREGSLRNTGNQLDLAITGEGFMQVRLPSGEVAYTRNGALSLDAEGRLRTQQGYLLEPEVVVPPEVGDLSISPEGVVSVRTEADNEIIELGQLELVTTVNKSAFEGIGENLYRLEGDSRDLLIGTPGTEGFGRLQQGFLEGSNVQVVEEMIAMISGQRAYEANSRVIRTSDEMMQETNRLR
ncbi:MAG: flagellar basal-body rod protein FlgG [Myxococcota bacterium]